jgi:hypothetical protein
MSGLLNRLTWNRDERESRTLTKFTYIGNEPPSDEPMKPTMRGVWDRVLLPNAPTLESIQIRHIYELTPGTLSEQRGGIVVDFAPFKRLTFLSLSFCTSWVTIYSPSQLNVLAPCLQVFEWCRDGEGSVGCGANRLGGFQEREEDYLRKLATAAKDRGIPLRSIVVRFTPAATIIPWSARKPMLSREFVEGMEYPWDRMDRLVVEMLPLGIQLSYNKTVHNKEKV